MVDGRLLSGDRQLIHLSETLRDCPRYSEKGKKTQTGRRTEGQKDKLTAREENEESLMKEQKRALEWISQI